MATLKCTGHIAKLGGLRLSKPPMDTSEDWHANIFKFNRLKYVLFCHDRSRLACLSVPVRKQDISHMPRLLGDSLEIVLRSEKFSDAAISSCLLKVKSFELAKTNNRSVLGSLNEYGQLLEHHACYDDIVEPEELASLVKRLNNMPLIGPHDGSYAIKVYRQSMLHAI